jgi:thioredoxin 1
MWSDRHRKNVLLVFFVIILIGICFSVPAGAQNKDSKPPTAVKALPRMLDLGRNQCTPCKMMAPVLAELKREYAGIVDIEYINVAENPDAMKKLGLSIRAVPFQIFYDASGKILKRHYGYMSKEEILNAFKEVGFILAKGPEQKKK